MRYWLGVVSRDHVREGTALGIAQLGHGRRGGLARLAAGDWLVYYSPRTRERGGEPVQGFTAIGRVADDELRQVGEGEFRPWRRRVEYLTGAVETPIRSVRLDLTDEANWGYQLRRGLLELSDHDFAAIKEAMCPPARRTGP